MIYIFLYFVIGFLVGSILVWKNIQFIFTNTIKQTFYASIFAWPILIPAVLTFIFIIGGLEPIGKLIDIYINKLRGE